MTFWPALHGGGRAFSAAGCVWVCRRWAPLLKTPHKGGQQHACLHAACMPLLKTPVRAPWLRPIIRRHELPREVLRCLHCSHMYHK